MEIQQQERGFNQMEQSLSHAIEEFSEQSPELLATLTAALRPIGEYSMKAWNLTSGFVRRHPVQSAIGVAAIGFIAAQLYRRASMMTTEADMPRSSDGRQY